MVEKIQQIDQEGDIDVSDNEETNERFFSIDTVNAIGTRHSELQTNRVSDIEDIAWIVNIWNELSNPQGAKMSYNQSTKQFEIQNTNN